MRRLLAWTTILMICTSLIIFSLRGSSDSACVRLEDQITGSVLTVDLNTQRAQLDARTIIPIMTYALVPDELYGGTVSPDQRYVMYTLNENGGEYDSSLIDLAFGLRSTGSRYLHRLSENSSILEYAWSPTSTHIVFTEFRAWKGQGDIAVANLVVMDVTGRRIKHELIPDFADDNWAEFPHPFSWSPDGSVVTITAFRDGVGATLIVQPIADVRAKYITFSGEVIQHVEWSPMNSVAIVTTAQMGYYPLSNHKVYFIGADGNLSKAITLIPDYEPQFDNYTSGQYWSPDGQYVLLAGPVYADVFNALGNRVVPTLSRTRTSYWSTLPHTLLYQIEQNGHQSFLALNAATGQATPLVSTIANPDSVSWWFFPDESEIVITGKGEHGGNVLHIIPQDLSINATPFGEINLDRLFLPSWSPDKRKIAVVDEMSTAFVVKWWSRDSGLVQQYRVVKRGLPEEQVSAEWLTDDVMLISSGQNNRRAATLMLLNTQTMRLFSLVSDLEGSEQYRIRASNASYITLKTPTGFSFYVTKTGQLLLSVPLPTDYSGYEIYPDPSMQAVLFHTQTTLYLGTTQSMNKITEEGSWAAPAWSPDGSMFAYSQWADNGWALNILSREGKLLKSFFRPHNKFDPRWDNIRWTNCD